MRVLLLITDLECGGSPQRIVRLAKGLAAQGVDVHVACLAPEGPLGAELRASGIPAHACGAQHARDIGALARLAACVRQTRPDLVHATLFHANVAARLVGGALGIPVIGSTATIEVERGWHLVVERLTAPLECAHIVNASALAEHVVQSFGIDRGRVFVVPPSLDPIPQPIDRSAARRALRLAPDAFVVAWVGRLDPVKRLELLVQCAERSEAAGWHFVLVGDGPERTNIEREINASSAADRVHLLGWRTDVAAILSAADALLITSRTEGVPNAALEALACGVPVVSVDLPTLRELTDLGAPVLIAPTATPAMLTGELRFLDEHPNIRAVFREQAMLWAAETLDPRRTVSAVLAAYESVLASTPP